MQVSRRSTRGAFVSILLALSVLLARTPASPVGAAPGDLDPSFGAGGIVSTEFAGVAEAHGVLAQGDGKILLAGEANDGGASFFHFALARYNTDGSLDSAFGTGGKVITVIGPGDDVANCVARSDDGKILVAGRSFNGSDNDFALARYSADGSPDRGFGNGGTVVVPTGPGNDRIFLVNIDADGKILALGLTSGASGDALMLARFNADGSLDGGFGNGGVAIDAGAADPPLGFSIQANGGILLRSFTGTQFVTRRPSGRWSRPELWRWWRTHSDPGRGTRRGEPRPCTTGRQDPPSRF